MKVAILNHHHTLLAETAELQGIPVRIICAENVFHCWALLFITKT